MRSQKDEFVRLWEYDDIFEKSIGKNFMALIKNLCRLNPERSSKSFEECVYSLLFSSLCQTSPIRLSENALLEHLAYGLVLSLVFLCLETIMKTVALVYGILHHWTVERRKGCRNIMGGLKFESVTCT